MQTLAWGPNKDGLRQCILASKQTSKQASKAKASAVTQVEMTGGPQSFALLAWLACFPGWMPSKIIILVLPGRTRASRRIWFYSIYEIKTAGLLFVVVVVVAVLGLARTNGRQTAMS
jgi:hypothetical protein